MPEEEIHEAELIKISCPIRCTCLLSSGINSDEASAAEKLTFAICLSDLFYFVTSHVRETNSVFHPSCVTFVSKTLLTLELF